LLYLVRFKLFSFFPPRQHRQQLTFVKNISVVKENC
jgi:hypothetical protein